MIIFTICNFGHSITRGQDVQVDHGGQVAILPTPSKNRQTGRSQALCEILCGRGKVTTILDRTSDVDHDA